ncbi:hypothetical protein L7F22_014694 [Adiantum nelumboides]|nr:hypothetical protein [Adiantum nelumboides]
MGEHALLHQASLPFNCDYDLLRISGKPKLLSCSWRFCKVRSVSESGQDGSVRLTAGPTSTVQSNGKAVVDESELHQWGVNRRLGSEAEEVRSDALRRLANEMFLVKSSGQFEVDYLGESTKGDLNIRDEIVNAVDTEGFQVLDNTIEEAAKVEAREAEKLLRQLQILPRYPHMVAERGIFCSRTLNLRSITTIGYDMDYTLIHYNVNAWEGRAYEYGMENLGSMGYAVEGLSFDPDLIIRGLIMDKKNGNVVKADRFGYVKRAMHGTKMLSNRAISELYGRELVDLRNESRWEFLNTLFSVSEAVMYLQMVERLDEGALPSEIPPMNYQGLYKVVAKALFKAHVEGQLKNEIINEPERFVELDPELPLALLDQKEAGKRLLLITNSDYHYTNKMMQHAFNRFLPDNMDWRALFDMVIVSAKKPDFFQISHPLYEVVTKDGLMRPCFKAKSGLI